MRPKQRPGTDAERIAIGYAGGIDTLPNSRGEHVELWCRQQALHERRHRL